MYKTLKEVLTAVKMGVCLKCSVLRRRLRAEYCKPEDPVASDADSEEVFVVWAGKQTGVMSAAEECVKATAGVEGAKAEGPLPRSEADAL